MIELEITTTGLWSGVNSAKVREPRTEAMIGISGTRV
jgi:hypothetical protein